jgi:predicted nucleotidyltransferase
MVIDAQTLNKNLASYILDVIKAIPIDRVYLYGSYANGAPHEWSDVDVCFFSDYFHGKNRIDVLCELSRFARKYNPDICFEPNAFPTSELTNDNPFVKEILRTGKEISIAINDLETESNI